MLNGLLDSHLRNVWTEISYSSYFFYAEVVPVAAEFLLYLFVGVSESDIQIYPEGRAVLLRRQLPRRPPLTHVSASNQRRELPCPVLKTLLSDHAFFGFSQVGLRWCGVQRLDQGS